MKTPLTVSVTIDAPLARVWECLTEPLHVQQWCHASADWGVGTVTNDLRIGGAFATEMKALDGSQGFVFSGIYTEVTPQKSYAYTMEDGRTVVVTLIESGTGVTVSEVFDPEDENPPELQAQGWQSILTNLKLYTESL